MFNILYQQKFHGFIELSVCNLCACITLGSHGAFKALWFVAPYTNLETIFSECSNIEAKIPKILKGKFWKSQNTENTVIAKNARNWQQIFERTLI